MSINIMKDDEMSRIEIRKFGPIEELSLDLNKKINLIIGPQASGKSTLAKIVYFCNKIKDYYIDFILQDSFLLETHPNELYISFLKHIRKKFMESFGTTKHLDPAFNIRYFFNEQKTVSIRLNHGYALFKFSPSIEREIQASLFEIYGIYKNNPGLSFAKRMQLKQEVEQHFTETADTLFCAREDVIYIPAGRSLLSVLSEQLDVVNTAILDLSMKDFIERIRVTKERFGTRLDTVVSDYLKTVKGQIKNTDLEIAQELINKILKADYVNDSDSEKLYIDKNHLVKLIYGSSGQQESLWILLLLFITILEQKKALIILEEPEAHLFPNAQKYIMELIALTMNSSGSQIIITTHSPYILTSANLLIQSGIVENSPKLRNEESVIRKQLRISPEMAVAYKISDVQGFTLEPIMDLSSGLINSFEIDKVSDIINAETNRLIDLEIKYDL